MRGCDGGERGERGGETGDGRREGSTYRMISNTSLVSVSGGEISLLCERLPLLFRYLSLQLMY